MKKKINLESILNNKTTPASEMAFINSEGKRESFSCLMNLRDHKDDIVIYLPIKHLVLPENYKNKPDLFVQWWLDFIKNSICDLYNAVIQSFDNEEIVIYIEKDKKLNNYVRFTNYELIRYLVGIKFNKIPALVYELMEYRRRYFENDIDIFYYSLYILEIFNYKNGETCNNPNYTWHISTNITVQHPTTVCPVTLYFPICVKPVNYKNATSNFGYLQNILGDFLKYYQVFANENSGKYKFMWTDNKMSNNDKIKKRAELWNEDYEKYVKPVNINIDNIYGFKKSLLYFAQICKPEIFSKNITLKPQIIEKNESAKAV